MANPDSEAMLGYGTKILLGDGGSPQTFVEIAEVGDFEDGDTMELVEVTNHQSPNRRREYIAAMEDGAEMTLPMNYIPSHPTQSRATGLRGMKGQRKTFRLEAPGETEGYEFNAIIMGVSRSFPVQGVMQITVTLKKTGSENFYAIS